MGESKCDSGLNREYLTKKIRLPTFVSPTFDFSKLNKNILIILKRLLPFFWNKMYLSIVLHQDISSAVSRYEWGDADHILGDSCSFINFFQVLNYRIPQLSGACTHIRNRGNGACTKK